MSFHLVEFISDNSTYVVSCQWVLETNLGLCSYWPPKVSKLEMLKLLKNHHLPEPSWSKHRIRILCTTDDIDEAIEKLSVAEDTSNLETDAEAHKKTRKQRKRIVFSDTARARTMVTKQLPPPPPVPCSARKYSSLPRVQDPLRHSADGRHDTQGSRAASPMGHFDIESDRAGTPIAATEPDITTPEAPFTASSYSRLSAAERPASQVSSPVRAVPTSASSRMSLPPLEAAWEPRPSVFRVERSQHVPEDQSSRHLLQQLVETTSVLESRFKAFERKVFMHNKEILLQLRELEKHSFRGMMPLSVPDDCPPIPATTFKMLEDLDTYLQDEKNLTSLVNFFATKGGTDEKDAVRVVLRSVVSNDLAIRCSWKGSQGEKHPLSTLDHVLKMILGSVRLNFVNATDANIKGVIKKWLYFAADRNGGRSQRRKHKSN